MKQLSILTVDGIGILKVPKTIVNLVGLSEVDFDYCNFTGVPISHGCFVGLKKLKFRGCSGLSCVLNSCHGLESLTVLYWPESESIGKFLGSLSHLTSLTSLTLNECFITSEEPTPCYDLAQLTLLTDLDLSFNSFLRFPISIHQLPRLTCLILTMCPNLEVLPELPTSLRELHVQGCGSLDASNVNDVISKACCGFAESSNQDPEDILQMRIGGKETPAWFDHQEEDNGVSISFPHNCPPTETVALALCFQFHYDYGYATDGSTTVTLLTYNGKEFINNSLLKILAFGDPACMCIVCVNGYYLSKLLCQPNRFQLLTPYGKVVQRCGARWVCKQDIQDFKKTESEARKRKAIVELNTDMISDCSPSNE
ncbi:hypothetical protein PIB30_043889 [Stylosanthes scabra]|uniref:C-JID domain-containing protein n=1 Tax=Stylosanthes scabra TaxID=79078 RepID=A0ABU6TG00_9FABA|nr:hypothetical protein [Stylosanthes scabra]